MEVTLYKTFSDFCNVLVLAILRDLSLKMCHLKLVVNCEFVIIQLFSTDRVR